MKEYRVEVVYSGRYWPEYDKKIEKLTGRHAGGSGMGFGERDMGFYYKTKKGAQNALAKLKKSKLKIKVYLEENNNE